MGSLVGLIIFGAVIGVLARFFMKGEQNIGTLWTVVLGVLGALAGYYIAGALGVGNTNGIDWIRWIISIVVSIALISIYMAVRGRSSARV